jgi:hypothetical protein
VGPYLKLIYFFKYEFKEIFRTFVNIMDLLETEKIQDLAKLKNNPHPKEKIVILAIV